MRDEPARENVMRRKPDEPESEDDLRPEYDFSKMRLIGRGIYAERYRAGTKVVLLGEAEATDEEKLKSDSDT